MHHLQVIGHAAAERLLLSCSMVPPGSSTWAVHCCHYAFESSDQFCVSSCAVVAPPAGDWSAAAERLLLSGSMVPLGSSTGAVHCWQL
jgi:hypothetical protein